MSWRDKAACVGTDPEIFFRDHQKARNAAKAICADCPVRLECLAYALSKVPTYEAPDTMEFGVFGGLSARERRLMPATERRKILASYPQ